MLKETFFCLLKKYTTDQKQIDELWLEIEHHYSQSDRYYHTLKHLNSMLNSLLEIKAHIKKWDTVLFSLYYHDIIYNATKSNNEEKSAMLAEKRLKQLNISNEIIHLCKEQILATKLHQFSEDSDTNYFTDADLSILGQNQKTYLSYSQNVRKEYAIYPDFIYNPGRKKVLIHFMTMERIFKTDYFYSKFEIIAKQNIKTEIELL